MGKILSRPLGIEQSDGDPIPTFDFITLANMRDGIAKPVQVVGIDITENGEYEAPPGYAYSPVNVNVSGGTPTLITKTITENGTYSAEDDDADGYSEVTVNVSGSTQYQYALGGFYRHNVYKIETRENHVKITATNSVGNQTIGLREFNTINCPLWFTINAGDTYEIKFYNVVNAGGALWSANAKKAGTTTSLNFGIGSNSTWLDGATVSGTQVSTAEIGCWFVYVSNMVSGNVLEFDMAIKVNGTRIL